MRIIKIVLYISIVFILLKYSFSEELNIYKAKNISLDYKYNKVIANKVEKAVYLNYTIKANKFIYDKGKNILLLGKGIILDENKNYISGEYIEFNLNNNEIRAINSKIKYQDYIFWGKNIEGNLKEGYTLRRGYFTTCDKEKPHYKFSLDKGYYKIKEYIEIKKAIFKVGGVPLFFLPRYKKSLTKAQTNFEFQPGYSSIEGVKLKLGFSSPKIYSDIIKSRIYFDISEKRGVGTSLDFNYNYMDNEVFNYISYINDNIGTEYGKHKRWKFYNKMRLNLINDFKLTTEADLVSDPEFNRDFNEGLSLRYQTQREFDFTLYKRKIDSILRIDGKGIYNYNEDINKYEKRELVLPKLSYQLFAKKSDFFNKSVYLNIESDIEKFYDNSDSKTYLKAEVFPSVYFNNNFFKILNYNLKVGFIQTYEKETTSSLKEKQHNGKYFSKVSLDFRKIGDIKFRTVYNFKKRFSNKHNGYKGIEDNNINLVVDYKRQKFLFRTITGYDFRWLENSHKPHFKSSAFPLYNRIEYDFTKNTKISYYSKFSIAQSKYENAFLDFSTKIYNNTFIMGIRYFNIPGSDNFDLTNEYSIKFLKDYNFFYNYSLDLNKFHIKDIYTGIKKRLHCWEINLYYNKITSGNKEFWLTFNISAFPSRGFGLYSNIENQTIRLKKK